ncbi:MAG: histidine phosphatase family protein [Pseudomonadales bacterium]|jgi:phosphohistidine phosphatase|nr:histidine phosphatase family protein [Pseudomonadales bacterium]MDP7146889.1 histidine phosphatase family protein [Pseudomonadales bacterium]MDP7359864.1 histidine phosphatase family protein [Pseudomonadales bacterium]MDP7594006.1 histidine phosphatase family protein [Pseudomonadales bacterium]HJN48838.1 histidine phosphatase family protein [Pseudomonadales bacterium]|tara:strand:- start:299 stop:793 length:495 start_codon:yes stop_codon:yes gene_type:complete
MRWLYLIRHAKSSWSHPELSDFDRPLNKRGKRDAPVMGSKLAELGCTPDKIVSSPANRAVTTAHRIAEALQYPSGEIETDRGIYATSVNELVALISRFDAAYQHVCLVGHNPEITGLSDYLTDEYIDNVPTCGIVHIQLEIDDWRQIGPGSGTRLFFITPKTSR